MTIPDSPAPSTAYPPLRTLLPVTLTASAVAAGVAALVIWLAPRFSGPAEEGKATVSPALGEHAPGTGLQADLPPWGELDKVPIVTEKPEEFIDTIGLNMEPVEWVFDGTDAAGVLAILQGAGVPESLCSALMAPGIMEAGTGEVRIRPTDSHVMALSPAGRARLYLRLGKNEVNHYQMYPFTFPVGHVQKMLQGRVSPAVIASLEKLLYRRGKAECLSDLPVLLRNITDTAERRRLMKALTRQETLLLKVAVRPDTNIDRLIAYWGKGGRRKDLQPLLESLKQTPGGARIDAIHLIPGFARQRIYTYPDKVTTGQRDYDCHYSCMNFFRSTPDMSFLDSTVVSATLRSDYETVPGPSQMGDVILFTTNGDNVVHSCVYIADDVVFTKNGANPMQPWTFMTMENMEVVYPSDEPYTLVTYRLKNQ